MEIAVIGDLMVECIPTDVAPNSTKVYDPRELKLGGPAVNVAWHLSHLGQRCRLIGCVGDRDEPLLEPYVEVGVDRSAVRLLRGASDTLFVVTVGGSHHSIYIKAPIPDEFLATMVPGCRGAEGIVLNGSRHANLRKGFAELAASTPTSTFVAFNPSYAVFTYENEDELEAIVARSDLTILNHLETGFVCSQLRVRDADELSRRFGRCIVTTGQDRGAVIYRNGRATGVDAISRVPGDVLGAGDAFLTGLLVEVLANGLSAEDAGAFAAGVASFVATTNNIRPTLTEAEVRERVRQHRGRRD